MNQSQELIHKFYTAFANSDVSTMSSCYHENILFNDPVFENLKGSEVSEMWKMLIDRSNGNLKIEFQNVVANDKSGSATWIATYNFSKTGRKVVNKIDAYFEFQDGLFIKHTDQFDIWKWSTQAFGIKGFLLGWTNFMQQKIQEQAKLSLKKHKS